MKEITHSICRFTLIGGALAAALAASGGAQAQIQHIVATARINGGGEMLMTSVTCGTNGKEVLVLAAGSSRVTHRACAAPLLPDRLYILWDDGDADVVPSSSFLTATTAPAAPAPRAQFAVGGNQ